MDMQESFEKLHQKYGAKFLEELELESRAKEEAEMKLQANLEQQRIDGVAGEGKLASRFSGHVWKDCVDNITQVIDTIQHPTKTVQGAYRCPLEDLLRIYGEQRMDELVNMITLATLMTIMSRTLKNIDSYVDLSGASYWVGKTIKNEAEVEDFCQLEDTRGKQWVRKSLMDGIDKRSANSYKLVYFHNRMHKEDYRGLGWSDMEMEAMGAKLIEAVVYGSGYWVIHPVQVGTKQLMCITMTDWMKQAWEKNTDKLVANAVSYLPMMIPPAHWSTPYNGGYYGASRLHTQLIRLHLGGPSNIHFKRYVDMLQRVDLHKVYNALNAMQDTAFHINTYILGVMEKIQAQGGDFGGIPRMKPLDTLPELPDTATPEEIKAHKKKLVGIYKAETARKSKALKFLMTMAVAKKFKDQENIYFPWNIDYRGRCYPIPTTLSPQGDDISKSLLLFTNGTPIKEDDWKWLAIHGANIAGHDKVPFAERQQWVLNHTADIIKSAEDPLGYTWWYDESKNDYPMEFLAFCNEWKKLQEYKQAHGCYEGFVSTLPLAFDGTCSGLQHFSALLRDEIGGHAVNLVPSPKVQDIYSIVADKVNKVLTKDAKSGTGDNYKRDKKTGEVLKDSTGKPMMKYGTKTLAQHWIVFNRIKFGQDGITRKVCKRSVMTLAYGSKQYGFKENILEDIIKPYVTAHPEDSPFIAITQAAVYMASLIWEAVGDTVVKAVEGMQWLQTVAKLVCKSGEVVTWFTPNGLPVQQNYLKSKSKNVQVRFGGGRVRLYVNEATDEVDSRAQANGISPNFIHSMDATHLQRVVAKEKELGNDNFMMIHDSFGTDAAHAGELYRTIRSEFVNLYEGNNYLANFLDNVKHLIPEEELDNVPAIPTFGKLNLKDVLKSDFCFA